MANAAWAWKAHEELWGGLFSCILWGCPLDTKHCPKLGCPTNFSGRFERTWIVKLTSGGWQLKVWWYLTRQCFPVHAPSCNDPLEKAFNYGQWEDFFVLSYQCFPFAAGLGLFVKTKFSVCLKNKVWLIVLFGRREERQNAPPHKARERVKGKVNLISTNWHGWSRQTSVHILSVSKATLIQLYYPV